MKERIRFIPSLVSILALVSLIIAGCAAPPAGTATTAASPAKSAASPTTAAAASKQPIKIGGIFAITGPASSLGIPERNTAQMVAEQINAAGGINGAPIDLIIYDTESDETKTVLATKRLIEEDKVVAIIGPSQSGETLAIIDTVEKAEVPLVSAAASIKIVDPVKKWVFKTPQSDVLIITALIDHLKAKNYTKIGWLSTSNAFGDSGKVEFEKLAPGAGLNIVASESFAATDTDMTAQLTRVKGANPDAIVVWAIPPAASIASKNALQLGITQPIFQSHGIGNKAFIDLAGEAANGVVFPVGKLLVANGLPDSDPQKKVLVQYAKDYETKFGAGTLSTFGGHAWDSLWVVVEALKKSGPDRAKLRDAIENTKEFVGITGVFTFSSTDHNGLDNRAVTMVEIKDGKWVPAK